MEVVVVVLGTGLLFVVDMAGFCFGFGIRRCIPLRYIRLNYSLRFGTVHVRDHVLSLRSPLFVVTGRCVYLGVLISRVYASPLFPVLVTEHLLPLV